MWQQVAAAVSTRGAPSQLWQQKMEGWLTELAHTTVHAAACTPNCGPSRPILALLGPTCVHIVAATQALEHLAPAIQHAAAGRGSSRAWLPHQGQGMGAAPAPAGSNSSVLLTASQ